MWRRTGEWFLISELWHSVNRKEVYHISRPVRRKLSTLNRRSKVYFPHHIDSHELTHLPVIARNALAQEESEEFAGDFHDPIDLNLDKESDGCAC